MAAGGVSRLDRTSGLRESRRGREHPLWRADGRRRSVPGGRHAQDVRPVPVDQVHVHLAADQPGRTFTARSRGSSAAISSEIAASTFSLAPRPRSAANALATALRIHHQVDVATERSGHLSGK